MEDLGSVIDVDVESRMKETTYPAYKVAYENVLRKRQAVTHLVIRCPQRSVSGRPIHRQAHRHNHVDYRCWLAYRCGSAAGNDQVISDYRGNLSSSL